MLEMTLMIVAVLPPMLFLLSLIKADRREPEPMQMILFTLGLGILSTVPAVFVEFLFGLTGLFGEQNILGAFLASFIQIAPAEEFFKLAVILLFVWKSPHFNEENDGIVYVTVSAIGFALFENILYVLDHGFGTGVLRAITSIPLHTFAGVLMGSYVGKARFAATRRESRILILKGFLLAWFYHGAYDTLAMTGNLVLILILVIILFIVGTRIIKAGTRSSWSRWWDPDATVQITLDTQEEELERIRKKYGDEKIERDEDGRPFLKPEKIVWKAVVGRLLIGIAVVTILIGFSRFSTAAGGSPGLFSFFLYFGGIPGVLGALLESSYRYRANNKHYFVLHTVGKPAP